MKVTMEINDFKTKDLLKMIGNRNENIGVLSDILSIMEKVPDEKMDELLDIIVCFANDNCLIQKFIQMKLGEIDVVRKLNLSIGDITVDI